MLISLQHLIYRTFPEDYHDQNKIDLILSKYYFKPRRDVEIQYTKPPIDWQNTSNNDDRNWLMQLHSWNMFCPIMDIFDNYSDKSKLLSFFLTIIEDWFKSYGLDRPTKPTPRMPQDYAWYDMCIGFRALQLTFLLNRIQFYKLQINVEHSKILDELIIQHINVLSRKQMVSINNHGLWQIHGLVGMLQMTDPSKRKKTYQYAMEMMLKIIQSQFHPDGIHNEHSPHYHILAIDVIKNIIQTGWYNGTSTIQNIVDKAVGAVKYLLDPSYRCVAIGDSLPTYQKDYNIQPYKESDDKYISKYYESGYAIIRSNWDIPEEKASYLFFMGSYHSKVHKHRDDLSFEWYENGRKIICDSGKYGYKSDQYRHYFQSNRAHNNIEVDGLDIIKLEPYGNAIKDVRYHNKDENIFIIQSEISYPKYNIRRNLYFKPQHWIVIDDVIMTKKGANCTQWLHVCPVYYQYTEISPYSTIFVDQVGNRLFIDNITNNNRQIYFGDQTDGMFQGFISEKDYIVASNYAIGHSAVANNKPTQIITSLSLSQDSQKNAKEFISKNCNNSTHDISSELELNADQTNTREKNLRLLPNVPHHHLTELNNKWYKLGKNTYSINWQGIKFYFYLHLKQECDQIIVMLPGARIKNRIINLQRHSWSDSINASVFSFADPTTTELDSLDIGWFQGCNHNNCLQKFISLLQAIQSSLNVCERDVIIFGSSAGGFVSLKIANHFPCATVWVINPQIYLNKYHKRYYDAMVSYAYPNTDSSTVSELILSNFTVDIDYQNRVAPTIIWQNKEDKHHFIDHLMPYLKCLPHDTSDVAVYRELSHDKPSIFFYHDIQLQHTPPDKTTICEYFNNILGFISS